MKGLQPPRPSVPWGIFRQLPGQETEILHLGLYPDEEAVWTVFTGWGDKDDIAYYTNTGCFASQIKVYLNADTTYRSHYRHRSSTNRVRA